MSQVRRATVADAAAIAEIYNHAVVNTTAIWNDACVDAADRAAWITARSAPGLAVLVFEDAGEVLGYASYGPFRPQIGSRQTVEHSVYVAPDHQGKGIARQLMARLIETAKADQHHKMVAAIDASNEISLQLHRKLGFGNEHVMRQVGQKFGRWLDLALLELTLDERPYPAGAAV